MYTKKYKMYTNVYKTLVYKKKIFTMHIIVSILDNISRRDI